MSKVLPFCDVFVNYPKNVMDSLKYQFGLASHGSDWFESFTPNDKREDMLMMASEILREIE